MTNWQDIDTTTDEGLQLLNIEIAKRLGFWVYHYDKDFADQCFYMLMEPLNFDPGTDLVDHKRKTEEEAWRDLPPFTSNIVSALALIKDEPRVEIAINSPAIGDVAMSRWVQGHGWVHGEAKDGNVALAICRWFLTAQDIKEGQSK